MNSNLLSVVELCLREREKLEESAGFRSEVPKVDSLEGVLEISLNPSLVLCDSRSQARVSSPPVGLSTFKTSAPKSASIIWR